MSSGPSRAPGGSWERSGNGMLRRGRGRLVGSSLPAQRTRPVRKRQARVMSGATAKQQLAREAVAGNRGAASRHYEPGGWSALRMHGLQSGSGRAAWAPVEAAYARRPSGSYHCRRTGTTDARRQSTQGLLPGRRVLPLRWRPPEGPFGELAELGVRGRLAACAGVQRHGLGTWRGAQASRSHDDRAR